MSACRTIPVFNPRLIFPARIHIHISESGLHISGIHGVLTCMGMTECWRALAMFIQCDVSSPLGDLRVRTFARKRRTGSCLPMASSSSASIWITHALVRSRCYQGIRTLAIGIYEQRATHKASTKPEH